METPTIADWERHLISSEAANSSEVEDILSLPQNRYLAPLIKPATSVLEAGCGNGKNVFAFARAGAHAVGLDFSPRLVAVVQEQLTRTGFSQARAVTGDMMALPFPENTFDLYTSFGVYEHFKAPQHRVLFAEAFRVIKPGGAIFLEVPQFWSPWTVRREIRYWFRKLRPPTIVWQRNMRRGYVTRFAEAAGFKTVESHVFDAHYALQKGFSLDSAKLAGVPNPFYWMRSGFRSFGDFCERKEWLGHTLVYIGRKQ